MFENFFDPSNELWMGALTGLIFGFLLQRGGVTRFDVIVNQFLLRDFTVAKIMLTAIVVGGVGVYAMRAAWGDSVPLHLKSATLAANVLGGLIFGVGMAVLGYCPGTGVGAVADGSRHAIPGLIGMLVGAGIYAETYPWVQANILPKFDYGKVTLPELTGVSPWVFFAALAVVLVILFAVVRRPSSQPEQ